MQEKECVQMNPSRMNRSAVLNHFTCFKFVANYILEFCTVAKECFTNECT